MNSWSWVRQTNKRVENTIHQCNYCKCHKRQYKHNTKSFWFHFLYMLFELLTGWCRTKCLLGLQHWLHQWHLFWIPLHSITIIVSGSDWLLVDWLTGSDWLLVDWLTVLVVLSLLHKLTIVISLLLVLLLVILLVLVVLLVVLVLIVVVHNFNNINSFQFLCNF